MRAVTRRSRLGLSARVEKTPKEEAAGAGWSAYGQSVRLRLFKVAIGGSVGCKRIAPKACNEMIGTGAQIFRRLASAISRYAGLAEADRRHPATHADPSRFWLM
jgi:hypothetical protein